MLSLKNARRLITIKGTTCKLYQHVKNEKMCGCLILSLEPQSLRHIITTHLRCKLKAVVPSVATYVLYVHYYPSNISSIKTMMATTACFKCVFETLRFLLRHHLREHSHNQFVHLDKLSPVLDVSL